MDNNVPCQITFDTSSGKFLKREAFGLNHAPQFHLPRRVEKLLYINLFLSCGAQHRFERHPIKVTQPVGNTPQLRANLLIRKGLLVKYIHFPSPDIRGL
jgi:hypothetical protein